MAKYFHINIPEPCKQLWENMEPRSQGRFCQNCSKTVVDFSGMSDEQLLQFFTNRRENICGRFHSDQLNKSTLIPSKPVPWLRYFFQFTLPALMLSYKATAQQKIKSCFSIPAESGLTTSVKQPLATKKKVRGTIVDKQGVPVPFASVMIRGTRTGVGADSIGRFTLSIPSEGAALEVSALGYEDSLVNIAAGQMDAVISIQLKEKGYVCKDEVIVTSAVKRRGCYIAGFVVVGKSRSIHQPDSVIKPVMAEAEKVFPNPASRNGSVNISWKKPIAGIYHYNIVDAAGEIVQSGTVQVAKSTRQSLVELNLHSAGIYFLRILQNGTASEQAFKLIVQ